MFLRILFVSFSLFSFNQKVLPMLSPVQIDGQIYNFCELNSLKESNVYIKNTTITQNQ